MSLIIPKYLQDREDYLHYECDEFSKKLNIFIDDHQELRDPYFVLFKQNFDRKNPGVSREAISLYLKRPPLIKGSMVFWVDNTRGACFLLWSITHQGMAKFNIKAAEKLGEVLRVVNV